MNEPRCCGDKLREALQKEIKLWSSFEHIDCADDIISKVGIQSHIEYLEAASKCSCESGQIFWGSVNDNGCICCCYHDEALARKAFAEVSGHVRLIKLQEIPSNPNEDEAAFEAAWVGAELKACPKWLARKFYFAALAHARKEQG